MVEFVIKTRKPVKIEARKFFVCLNCVSPLLINEVVLLMNEAVKISLPLISEIVKYKIPAITTIGILHDESFLIRSFIFIYYCALIDKNRLRLSKSK